jgi:hypothetical protein
MNYQYNGGIYNSNMSQFNNFGGQVGFGQNINPHLNNAGFNSQIPNQNFGGNNLKQPYNNRPPTKY